MPLSVFEFSNAKMSQQAEKQGFSIGDLIEFQWKLGVTVKSSDKQNVGVPYVSVLVKTKDPNQKISTHTFQMTLAEFQVN